MWDIVVKLGLGLQYFNLPLAQLYRVHLATKEPTSPCLFLSVSLVDRPCVHLFVSWSVYPYICHYG